MKDKQDNDYQDIIDILNACEPQKDGGHKLRWAVRIVGGYKRPAGGKDSKEKEAAFERGKERLLKFGGYGDPQTEKEYYCKQIQGLLK